MTENEESNNPRRCKQCDKLHKMSSCQALWITVTHTGDWRTDEYLCWECQWSPDFPTEPGMFWFYGWSFLRPQDEKPPPNENQPELYLVKAKHGFGNKLYFVAKGTLIFPQTSLGVWKEAEIPPAPEIEWGKILDRGEKNHEE